MKHTYLKTFLRVLEGLAAGASSAGNTDGTAIDLAAQPEVFAGTVVINVAAPTGSPSSFAALYKLQMSPDGSTGWTDVDTLNVIAAGVYQIGFKPVSVNQFIRVRRELSFVSGSSPTLPNSATVVLGDPKYGPL